ncbi:HEAT repeat domain-containing protein, partial [Candidatus Sumerlaeota bacterium]|nr:HEAT repeat domain-containing protein [Candidatus Sumerlaeota bacterium]
YVLSGTGDPRGVPAVISALEKDPSEIVRSVAAEALGQFGTDDARAALEKALKTEKSERVLQTIRKRLNL